MPLTVSTVTVPEAVFTESGNEPMAIPETVPSLFLMPVNSFGVMTVLLLISVLPVFHSLTQSSMEASAPSFPGVPDLAFDQTNDRV
ncbi:MULTISPECIES: hypothetical protein [Bacteroidales]|uniref:hypothetical protein n=1 Tax=Bacteroidales TaxID=171549 RepID=UPI001E561ABC|nr:MULTISPECIES: hypothetical protein [Bacteroidales]MDC1684402.1 hypothetical protein [Phocaeicola vulgatus]MDV7051077.1 hypothetical protein [Bacteroides ovatus]